MFGLRLEGPRFASFQEPWCYLFLTGQLYNVMRKNGSPTTGDNLSYAKLHAKAKNVYAYMQIHTKLNKIYEP